MNDSNGMAADLSPEEQDQVRKAMDRMRRRVREGNFRPPPVNPAKMDSIGPGIRVVQEATDPPVPIPGFELDTESNDA
jgi:hypothetical protein